MKQDRIWEAYQNDADLHEMGCRDGGRIKYVVRSIPLRGRVLNIGVGKGILEEVLLQQGVEVYSLDPSETTIRRLRDELSMGDRAQAGYSQHIPFMNAHFDCVIMTEVLEHLSDDILEQTLHEISRVLVPGGAFVGSVPADENLAQGMVVCPDCGKKFHRWGHVQSFSRDRLARILESHFDAVEVSRVVFLDWRNLNWKGKFGGMLRSMQARLDMRGSNQNLFFSATVAR